LDEPSFIVVWKKKNSSSKILKPQHSRTNYWLQFFPMKCLGLIIWATYPTWLHHPNKSNILWESPDVSNSIMSLIGQTSLLNSYYVYGEEKCMCIIQMQILLHMLIIQTR
jgi:hypothetical protein